MGDLACDTNVISSIVASGAKGHEETVRLLFDNLRSDRTLCDQKVAMIDQMNRYISSSQNLRLTGRNQFISLYDLIIYQPCSLRYMKFNMTNFKFLYISSLGYIDRLWYYTLIKRVK